MSHEPLAGLADDVCELVASARMAHRRAPRVGVEWEYQAGTYTVVVLVDGEAVVTASAAQLALAATRARSLFNAWQADSPEGLASALATSLAVARAGGLR